MHILNCFRGFALLVWSVNFNFNAVGVLLSVCIHHVFWQPSRGSRSTGKPVRMYVDCLLEVTGCSVELNSFIKKGYGMQWHGTEWNGMEWSGVLHEGLGTVEDVH